MNLADRYMKPPQMTVLCPHYNAPKGSKRCSDYFGSGNCKQTDGQKCIEWLRANGRSIPDDHPMLKPRQQTCLGRKDQPKPQVVKVDLASTEVECAQPVRQPITDEEIQSWRALNVELCIRSSEFGEVWLVNEYTGQDRKEITPEHAATMRLLLDAFPGTRVTQFDHTRATDDEKVK